MNICMGNLVYISLPGIMYGITYIIFIAIIFVLLYMKLHNLP